MQDISMRSSIIGGSLVITFTLSHFWWQRNTKGTRNGSIVGMRQDQGWGAHMCGKHR